MSCHVCNVISGCVVVVDIKLPGIDVSLHVVTAIRVVVLNKTAGIQSVCKLNHGMNPLLLIFCKTPFFWIGGIIEEIPGYYGWVVKISADG